MNKLKIEKYINNKIGMGIAMKEVEKGIFIVMGYMCMRVM